MKGVLFTIFALLAVAIAAGESGKPSVAYHCEAAPAITAEDRTAILKLINGIRADTANGKTGTFPKAANMREIRWETGMEIEATLWANNCTMVSSPHSRRNESSPYFNVKELVAKFKGCNKYSVPQWKAAFDSWMLEAKNMTVGDVNKYSQSTTRTQRQKTATLINWAHTSYIGCAYANHETVDGEKMYGQYIVCHLAEGGNVVDLPIYTPGEPASKCPADWIGSKNYPGLCWGDKVPPGPTDHLKPSPTPDTTVSNCSGKTFTDDNMKQFIDFINAERSRIALNKTARFPFAADMKQVSWDPSLAGSAVKAAGKCKKSTEEEQKSQKITEILYATVSPTPYTDVKWQAAFDKWFSLKSGIPVEWVGNYGVVKSNGSTPEIYSQLIWANSDKVGCAYSNDDKTVSGANGVVNQYLQYVVCHFRPAGNEKGKPIYTESKEKCSGCPSGTKCNDLGLCAAVVQTQ